MPDSYVKCYLRDGEKWLLKRKTRVVRRTTEPHFKQTLKYQVLICCNYLIINNKLQIFNVCIYPNLYFCRIVPSNLYDIFTTHQASEALGRTLVVMLWQRCGGFEHNLALGGAEICLDKLTLPQRTYGWYPLFPATSLATDESPD